MVEHSTKPQEQQEPPPEQQEPPLEEQQEPPPVEPQEPQEQQEPPPEVEPSSSEEPQEQQEQQEPPPSEEPATGPQSQTSIKLWLAACAIKAMDAPTKLVLTTPVLTTPVTRTNSCYCGIAFSLVDLSARRLDCLAGVARHAAARNVKKLCVRPRALPSCGSHLRDGLRELLAPALRHYFLPEIGGG